MYIYVRAYVKKDRKVGKLLEENGDVILNIESKLMRWKNYIEELYADERNEEHEVRNALNGPSITKEESQRAIARAKNRKTRGPDEIPVKILKILGEKAIIFLIRLFNDTGFMIQELYQQTG